MTRCTLCQGAPSLANACRREIRRGVDGSVPTNRHTCDANVESRRPTGVRALIRTDPPPRATPSGEPPPPWSTRSSVNGDGPRRMILPSTTFKKSSVAMITGFRDAKLGQDQVDKLSLWLRSCHSGLPSVFDCCQCGRSACVGDVVSRRRSARHPAGMTSCLWLL